MTSIPANRIVNVTPTVVGTGGTGLDVQGLFLTQSNRVPIGQVYAFPFASNVSEFFGPSSPEYAAARKYFLGYDGSFLKPANLLFAQYAATAVPAYLRGGSLAAMTLAQLKAVTGTITLTINGVAVTSASIDLSAATSFSGGAAIIQAALNRNDAAFTGAIAGTVLTVTAVASGALAIGQTVTGVGVVAGTVITALGTGTGGTGTYTVSPTQTVASSALKSGPALVTFDSVSSAFIITGGTPGVTGTITVADVSGAATSLKLTTATGAVTSQGAAASTPASAMDAVVAATQNFVTFSTIFQPSDDNMVAFADWASDQSSRFPYIQWDNNAAMTVQNDVSSAAARIRDAGYAGTQSIYSPLQGALKAAFVMGAIASIDFDRPNGRVNIALLTQTGLTADVTEASIADNLKANGYNYYGSFATANQPFLLFYNGSVTGPFKWMDSLVNSIWMANNIQLSLMTLLTTIHNIPYNAQGYALIDANLIGVVERALTFGAIRAGVPLSATQAAEINNVVGLKASDVITQRGWYIQIVPASPEVRSQRGSPGIILYYTDGQSVQQINVNSAEVQ